MDRLDLDRPDVQASLDGNGEAYARIVGRHQPRITARMWRFTHDRGVLEELVEEVFVEAYVSLRNFRATGTFAGWLHTIATRVGYRHWKRTRRAAKTVSLQDYDLPAIVRQDRPDPQAVGQVLHELLARLRPRDRLVLTLMYLEGLPLAQIAQQTGWSLTMVKVQAHRARKKLRGLLEESGLSDILEDMESGR